MRLEKLLNLHLLLAVLLLAGGLSMLTSCSEKSSTGQRAQATAGPTFTRDVAPILFQNCSYCHRAGQAAPFELLTYAEASKRAKQIAEAVESHFMPPWLPTPGFNQFQHERRLTPEQIATIKAWAAAGAPEGNSADLPAPPKFTSEWQLGQPDLVVKMPEPYALPADGPDIYRNFVIPIPNDRVRHVRAMEFRPGNARSVHHAFFAVDRTSESHRQDLLDAEPGYGGMHLPVSGEVPDGQFFSWQPGKVPMGGGASRAWQLNTNSWLVIQLHMQMTGKPESVQAEVGLYFAEQPGTDITFKLGLSSYDLNVPAGATNFMAEDAFELPADAELLAILPHAHYVARTMQGLATAPDGTSRWLLNIGRWDFNWQGEYWYQEPIQLTKGSRVGMRFFYDNSTNNPANPANPPRPVSYGLSSTDEMAELWLIFRLKSPADRAAFNRAVVPKMAREVVTYSQKLLEKDPANAQAWLRMGTAFYVLGQAERALDGLRRALQFDARLDEAHYYLGLVAYDSGNFTKAREEFGSAVQINRQNYKAHGYLGLVYLRLGDFQKSEASLTEALSVNPDDQIARNNLQLLNEVKAGHSPGTPPNTSPGQP
jgi:tetratricopeptide (TPR) repeat protein/mono/diheme cytochrome c family protein